MEIKLYALKLGLIAFWGIWFTIVLLTNVFAALRALRVVPQKWKFASQNFELVVRATSRYQSPRWLAGILFCGVVLWQLITVVMFGSAFASSLAAGSLDWIRVNAAFSVGIALWAAFMIADEIFMQYNNERSHVLLFVGQLVTLVTLYLLPG